MTATNLATRCAACSTVFRVVPDQLRVSSGWVRCGRCAAVFDATLDLFDIDLGTPVALDIAAQQQDAALPQDLAGFPSTTARDDDALPAGHGLWLRRASPPEDDASPADHVATPLNAPHRAPQAHTQATAPQAAGAAAHSAPAPGEEAIVIVDHVAGPSVAGLAGLLGDSASADQRLSAGADPADAPAFVRQADRAARWRSPGRRAALRAGIGALGLLLALQAALLWRDLLAAHMPSLKPALQQLCLPLGCQVLPLRRIERLSLESTNLGRLEPSVANPATEPASTAATTAATAAATTAASAAVSAAISAAATEVPRYRLSVLLRNRADTALMLPALDLSLTDARGRLVARRVLAPADLGLRQDSLGAGQELPLQAVLAIAGPRIEGYTVELFYP